MITMVIRDGGCIFNLGVRISPTVSIGETNGPFIAVDVTQGEGCEKHEYFMAYFTFNEAYLIADRILTQLQLGVNGAFSLTDKHIGYCLVAFTVKEGVLTIHVKVSKDNSQSVAFGKYENRSIVLDKYEILVFANAILALVSDSR